MNIILILIIIISIVSLLNYFNIEHFGQLHKHKGKYEIHFLVGETSKTQHKYELVIVNNKLHKILYWSVGKEEGFNTTTIRIPQLLKKTDITKVKSKSFYSEKNKKKPNYSIALLNDKHVMILSGTAPPLHHTISPITGIKDTCITFDPSEDVIFIIYLDKKGGIRYKSFNKVKKPSEKDIRLRGLYSVNINTIKDCYIYNKYLYIVMKKADKYILVKYKISKGMIGKGSIVINDINKMLPSGGKIDPKTLILKILKNKNKEYIYILTGNKYYIFYLDQQIHAGIQNTDKEWTGQTLTNTTADKIVYIDNKIASDTLTYLFNNK
jgi:hypothetical protein